LTYDGSNSWAVNGGDYDGTAEDSVTISGSDDAWYSWDITSLTSAWKAGTYNNYGVIITSTVDSTWKSFYSSDYTTDTTLIPKLVVTHYTSDTMLDANDDLALLDNNDNIIDYVVWGADAGTDDDDAVSAGQWSAGTYVDTSQLAEGETLGRDRDSSDTDTPSDWENVSNKADPFGIHSPSQTPGAQNIPEFNIFIIPICITFSLILISNKYQQRKISNGGKPFNKKKVRKRTQNGG
jgi:hypothetical protein